MCHLADHVAKNNPSVRVQKPFIFLAQNLLPKLQLCFFRLTLLTWRWDLPALMWNGRLRTTDPSASVMGPAFLGGCQDSCLLLSDFFSESCMLPSVYWTQQLVTEFLCARHYEYSYESDTYSVFKDLMSIDCQTKNYNILCSVLKVFGHYLEQKKPDIKEQTLYDVCYMKFKSKQNLFMLIEVRIMVVVWEGHVNWEGA